MPGVDRLEVLHRMTDSGPDFPVIVITSHGEIHGEIELAVCAIKGEAVDFPVEPCDRPKLLLVIA